MAAPPGQYGLDTSESNTAPMKLWLDRVSLAKPTKLVALSAKRYNEDFVHITVANDACTR